VNGGQVVQRERREQRRLAVLLRDHDHELGDAGEMIGEHQPLEPLELEFVAVFENEFAAEAGEPRERICCLSRQLSHANGWRGEIFPSAFSIASRPPPDVA
jgi:hypothetical protein